MKRLIICIVTLLILCNSIYAFKYRIDTIEYNTIGNFSPEALNNITNIDTQRLFLNYDELDLYLEEIEFKLLNTRLCNEVDFDYYENTLIVWETAAEDQTGEEHIIIPLYLIISIEETGNFIAAPYPKYDSNKGFEGKIKFRHNNFLGRMTVLDADASYIYSIEKKHSASLDTSFSIPFFTGITNNSFYTNLHAEYNFSDVLFTTDNYAGLQISIPVSFFSVDFAFEQHYLFDVFSFMKERIVLSLPFSIPLNFPLTITAQTYADYNWSTDAGYTPHVTVSPFIRLLSSNKVWLLNFQKGYDIQANAGFTYNFTSSEIEPAIDLTASIYYPLSNNLLMENTAPSNRIHLWYSGSQLSNKGSLVRGILDDELSGYSGVVINSDFTISLFQLYIDTLFQNEKLKIFNFELHMSPFADIACIFSPVLSFDVTTGLTLIIHPLSMKSIQGRISFGSNPLWAGKNKNYTSPYEVFIGLGLFY